MLLAGKCHFLYMPLSTPSIKHPPNCCRTSRLVRKKSIPDNQPITKKKKREDILAYFAAKN